MICIDVDAVIMRGLCNWRRELLTAAAALINCRNRKGQIKKKEKIIIQVRCFGSEITALTAKMPTSSSLQEKQSVQLR